MTATERYYLHGDPKEGAVDTYYCQRCDLFVDRAHFAVAHQPSPEARPTRTG